MKTKNNLDNKYTGQFFTIKIQIKNISFIFYYRAYEVNLPIFYPFNNIKMIFFQFHRDVQSCDCLNSMSSTCSTVFF